LPWSAAHIEIDEGKLKLTRISHRLIERELSICWRGTVVLTSAVQKVRDLIVELVQELNRRPERAAEQDVD
jgi:LysR family nitrogen assimilation transcriptional regulator